MLTIKSPPNSAGGKKKKRKIPKDTLNSSPTQWCTKLPILPGKAGGGRDKGHDRKYSLSSSNDPFET